MSKHSFWSFAGLHGDQLIYDIIAAPSLGAARAVALGLMAFEGWIEAIPGQWGSRDSLEVDEATWERCVAGIGAVTLYACVGDFVPCDRGGRFTHIDSLDGKPEPWPWTPGGQWRRLVAWWTGNDPRDFTRLECERCYGAGFADLHGCAVSHVDPRGGRLRGGGYWYPCPVAENIDGRAA